MQGGSPRATSRLQDTFCLAHRVFKNLDGIANYNYTKIWLLGTSLEKWKNLATSNDTAAPQWWAGPEEQHTNKSLLPGSSKHHIVPQPWLHHGFLTRPTPVPLLWVPLSPHQLRWVLNKTLKDGYRGCAILLLHGEKPQQILYPLSGMAPFIRLIRTARGFCLLCSGIKTAQAPI